MSLHTLPFVVFNLGCEMLYVLEQRLSTEREKSQQVLTDIVTAMFEPRFIYDIHHELQPVYSLMSIKALFSRLAHVSFMRLTEDGLEKLLELMFMSLKYQLYAMTHPRELIYLTLNHLEAFKHWAPKTHPVSKSIEHAEEVFRSKYARFSETQLRLLHQSLLQLVINKKSKISLFLGYGIQNSSGSFVWDVYVDGGRVLPPGAERPGCIRYFTTSSTKDELNKDKPQSSQLHSTQRFVALDGTQYRNVNTLLYSTASGTDHGTVLGKNMFRPELWKFAHTEMNTKGNEDGAGNDASKQSKGSRPLLKDLNDLTSIFAGQDDGNGDALLPLSFLGSHSSTAIDAEEVRKMLQEVLQMGSGNNKKSTSSNVVSGSVQYNAQSAAMKEALLANGGSKGNSLGGKKGEGGDDLFDLI